MKVVVTDIAGRGNETLLRFLMLSLALPKQAGLACLDAKSVLYAHHGEVRLTSAGRAEWVIRHRYEPTGTSATVAETMPTLNVPSACPAEVYLEGSILEFGSVGWRSR